MTDDEQWDLGHRHEWEKHTSVLASTDTAARGSVWAFDGLACECGARLDADALRKLANEHYDVYEIFTIDPTKRYVIETDEHIDSAHLHDLTSRLDKWMKGDRQFMILHGGLKLVRDRVKDE